MRLFQPTAHGNNDAEAHGGGAICGAPGGTFDQTTERLSGIFDDIAHVSMYAPYCDTFVMDTPTAELVRQPTVALECREFPS